MSVDYFFQAIILAAGTSSRMGQPKQLLEVGGDSMLDHTIAAARNAGIVRPILVLGAFKDKILKKSRLAKYCEIVINADYMTGQSSTLKKGVSKLANQCDAAIFLLCDQPLIGGKLLCEMMDRFVKSKPDILYPTYQNQRGNPVIISSTLFPRLMTATGDKGARFLFADSSLKFITYPVNDPAVVMDIDTPEAYTLISGKQIP